MHINRSSGISWKSTGPILLWESGEMIWGRKVVVSARRWGKKSCKQGFQCSQGELCFIGSVGFAECNFGEDLWTQWGRGKKAEWDRAAKRARTSMWENRRHVGVRLHWAMTAPGVVGKALDSQFEIRREKRPIAKLLLPVLQNQENTLKSPVSWSILCWPFIPGAKQTGYFWICAFGI